LAGLVQSDDNQDFVLSAADYRDYIAELSGVRLDVAAPRADRTLIHEAFDLRVDTALGGLDLTPLDPNANMTTSQQLQAFFGLELFCENIYESFFPFFNVTLSSEACNTSLAPFTAGGGIVPGDFAPLASALTGISLASLTEASETIRDVFDDYSSPSATGVIETSLLTSRAVLTDLFCRRIQFGGRLEDETFLPDIPGTLAANETSTLSPTPANVNGTLAPSPTTANTTESRAPTTSPTTVLTTLLPTTTRSVTPAPSPGGDGTAAPTLSAADFQACTMSMLVSDRNRDDLLQADEFVFFLNRQTDLGAATYVALDPLFQGLYDSLRPANDANGAPSVFGSKPGQGLAATMAQLANLQLMCSETDRVHAEYLEFLRFQPTSAPTLTPTASLGGNAITDSEFTQCKLFLLVSDGDRNSQVNPTEFVNFVNRLTINAFLGRPYSEIPSIFRLTFSSASGTNDFISIVGARAGQQATNVQLAALRSFCGDAYEAAQIWEESQTNSPTSSPSSRVTLSPTPPPSLTETDFRLCTNSLAVSDRTRDDFIDQVEYVAFLNIRAGNAFLDQDFATLQLPLQQNFFALQDATGLISVGGARPGPRTPEQAIVLLRVCSETERAIQRRDDTASPAGGPTTLPPTSQPTSQPTAVPTLSPTFGNPLDDPAIQRCIAYLDVADANRDDALAQLEYITFVDAVAEGADSFAPPLSSLPYVLRDNNLWIGGDDGLIDIRGVGEFAQLNGTRRLRQLSGLCRRTNSVVESVVSGNNETALSPHCYHSLAFSDQDLDSQLDETEFVFFVNRFQGLAPSKVDFALLDTPYQEYFNENKGSASGKINVEGSQPGQNPNIGQQLLLDYLCSEMANTVVQVRSSFLLLTSCTNALIEANEDSDDVLTRDEYLTFIYAFAGRTRVVDTFDALPPDLRVNFVELSAPGGLTINIDGWRGGQLSAAQRAGLTLVCTSSSEAISSGLSSLSPTFSPTPGLVQEESEELTILNGFVLSNEEALTSLDLRNADIADLEESYRLFVTAAISPLLSSRRQLRGGRRLVSDLSFGRTAVYQIIDVPCRASPQGTASKCMEAYGRFNVIVAAGEDVAGTLEEFTSLTQEAIASGNLQAQLDAVSPDSVLDILGATDSTTPGSRAPTVTPVATPSPTVEEGGRGGAPSSESGIDMMLVIGGGVVLLLISAVVGGVWCCCRRRKHKPVDDRRKPADDDEYFMDNQTMDQPEEMDQDEYFMDNQTMDQPEEMDEDMGMSVELSESGSDSMHDGVVPASPGSLLPADSDHSQGDTKFAFQNSGHDPPVYRQPGQGPAPDEQDPGWIPAPSSTGDNAAPEWNANPWGEGGIPGAMLSSESSDASEEELVDRSVAPSTTSFTQNTSRGADTFVSSSEDEQDHSNDFDDEEDGSMYDGDPTEPSDFYDDDEMDEADTIADTIAETIADNNTRLSLTSAQRRTQLKYRSEVEHLVRQVVPEEAENVESMLEQFFGREQVRGRERGKREPFPERTMNDPTHLFCTCLLFPFTGID
jgi:hypothetical protein